MVRQSFRLYVDSDVIISSLISTSGAAYMLLHNTEGVELCVSNFSMKELEEVVNRLGLDADKLHELTKSSFSFTEIKKSGSTVQELYAEYVRDINDAHVVAGAKQARANFLISYNIRHFDSEKLRQDFDIVLLTPGLFLQFLRCL